jgi:serine protease SohB
MAWWLAYGYFLICTITIVIAVLALVAGILALSKKPKDDTPNTIRIQNMTKRYRALEVRMREQIMSKHAFSKWAKARKQAQKQLTKAQKKQKALARKPRLYVLPFEGGLQAKQVDVLSHMVDAVLLLAKPEDRVLVSITSGGGVVHGYGLAAAELQRLRDAGLQLVAAVDKIAASGGYMMAAVANKIIAAPFAIVGSIGVVAQMPNFHRLLKKHGIDFEQITAGEHKRTLTTFGENTDRDRLKMQEDINDTHALFKAHVQAVRPQVDLEQVATGAFWYGSRALDLGLVDALQTSADYLLKQREAYDIFMLSSKKPKRLLQRMMSGAQAFWQGAQPETNV